MSESIYNLRIFNWIQKEIIEHIVNNCETRDYNKGDIILNEWDESNGEWYILKNWEVSIYVKWDKIASLTSGYIFWEIALLSDENRNATVKASTDIEVIILSLDDLVNMINNDENKINKIIIWRIEENLNMQ